MVETCKAAVFVGAERPLEIQEFRVPDVTPGTVLIRMQMAAVCGTDVHWWHDPKTPHPWVWGHENIGFVAKLSKEVTEDSVGIPLKEGDRVIFNVTPCGHCYNCVMGLRCTNNQPYGTTFIENPSLLRGGFGEYVLLDPKTWILRVPDSMSTERALMSVIGNHTIMNGYDKIGGITVGDKVVVQGAGPIGMGALTQARVMGAQQVIVIGAPASRLSLARELGADHTIDINEHQDAQERIEMVHGLTGQGGPDIVVECTGVPSAVQEGLEMVRLGGKYLVIGQIMASSTLINPALITMKELRLAGVMGPKVWNIVRSMQLLNTVITAPVEKLITHEYQLANINDAFTAHATMEAMIPVVRHGEL
jgi:threonine dehydrogenase-like Zn-dependent dehydrogenase